MESCINFFGSGAPCRVPNINVVLRLDAGAHEPRLVNHKLDPGNELQSTVHSSPAHVENGGPALTGA